MIFTLHFDKVAEEYGMFQAYALFPLQQLKIINGVIAKGSLK